MTDPTSASMAGPAKKKRRSAGPGARLPAASKAEARALAQKTAQDQERRSGRVGGLTALASVACWLGALLLANTTGGGSTQVGRGIGLSQPAPISSARQLLEFHRGQSDQAIATGLRIAGLVLSVVVAVYLFRLLRARTPTLSPRMVWLAAVGAVLVAGASILGYSSLTHVANEFIASGPRTSARAKHLLDSSSAVKGAAIFDLVSRAVLGAWVAITSLEMMRTDLLDKFLGYWGFAACGALVLLPIGDAMFVAWLGSIGLLAIGYWPGGRPAGWQRAVTAA